MPNRTRDVWILNPFGCCAVPLCRSVVRKCACTRALDAAGRGGCDNQFYVENPSIQAIQQLPDGSTGEIQLRARG